MVKRSLPSFSSDGSAPAAQPSAAQLPPPDMTDISAQPQADPSPAHAQAAPEETAESPDEPAPAPRRRKKLRLARELVCGSDAGDNGAADGNGDDGSVSKASASQSDSEVAAPDPDTKPVVANEAGPPSRRSSQPQVEPPPAEAQVAPGESAEAQDERAQAPRRRKKLRLARVARGARDSDGDGGNGSGDEGSASASQSGSERASSGKSNSNSNSMSSGTMGGGPPTRAPQSLVDAAWESLIAHLVDLADYDTAVGLEVRLGKLLERATQRVRTTGRERQDAALAYGGDDAVVCPTGCGASFAPQGQFCVECHVCKEVGEGRLICNRCGVACPKCGEGAQLCLEHVEMCNCCGHAGCEDCLWGCENCGERSCKGCILACGRGELCKLCIQEIGDNDSVGDSENENEEEDGDDEEESGEEGGEEGDGEAEGDEGNEEESEVPVEMYGEAPKAAPKLLARLEAGEVSSSDAAAAGSKLDAPVAPNVSTATAHTPALPTATVAQALAVPVALQKLAAVLPDIQAQNEPGSNSQNEGSSEGESQNSVECP